MGKLEGKAGTAMWSRGKYGANFYLFDATFDLTRRAEFISYSLRRPESVAPDSRIQGIIRPSARCPQNEQRLSQTSLSLGSMRPAGLMMSLLLLVRRSWTAQTADDTHMDVDDF